MEKQLSILVLDYNRPQETKLCLESIASKCSINKEVIYLANGNYDVNYAFNFYKQGLIDKLIVNKKNNGGGFGTIQLVNNSFNDYILWIECDCEIQANLDNELLSQLIELLNSGYSAIDLTDAISGNNTYSGRCFLMNREFYNSIKKDVDGVYGGPGPYNNVRYLESFIQEYFKTNDLKVAHLFNFIKDNGKFSIRELSCGGVLIHRTDNKQMWVINPLSKKHEEYPPLTDDEYVDMFNNNWPLWGRDKEGRIPEKWKIHSFQWWQD